MVELSLFKIINYLLALYLFQVLSTASWRNSLTQKFENSTLYCKTFALKLQNEDLRVYGYQSEDSFIFIWMQSNHPVHITVFKVVAFVGDIMRPFIFPYGVMLNLFFMKINSDWFFHVLEHFQHYLSNYYARNFFFTGETECLYSMDYLYKPSS